MKFTSAKIFGVILLITGFALCGAGIRQLVSPAQYQATARIKIERDITDAPNTNRPSVGWYDPYFIQTEFEVLKSEAVLGKVIEALDLNTEWGKYARGEKLKTIETMKLLQSRIELRPVRNTLLIEIRVRTGNPEEAAKIANAIAEAYRDYRQEKRKRLTLGGLKTLEGHSELQVQKIKAAQEKVNQLRKELKVPNPEPAIEEFPEKYAPYWEAKQELERVQRFSQILNMKIQQEYIDLNLPKTSSIEIVASAVPPKSSTGPNRLIGAVLLALGMISVFWACFELAHAD